MNAGVVDQLGMIAGPCRVGDITGIELIDDGLGLRDVHAGCRGVLTRYAMLEPILSGKEGEQILF